MRIIRIHSPVKQKLILATTCASHLQILRTARSNAIHYSGPRSVQCIEEGWRQKTRQNVVVLDWGARSNATLDIFGVIV